MTQLSLTADSDTSASPVAMTARDVVSALYRHFTPRWAVLTEVSARPAGRTERLRRIDVLMLRMAGCPGGVERMAIEVKVSRSDFLADVRQPDKQAPWRTIAHRHAYAVPAGLVRPDEVPADSGLLAVTARRGNPRDTTVEFTRIARQRPGHEPGPMPLVNIMDAFWRAARAEAAVKGHGFGVDAAAVDAEVLRAEVQRLRHDLTLRTAELDRQREQLQTVRKRLAAFGPPACETCSKPLHPVRGWRASLGEWQHRDEADAAFCLVLRTARAEEQRAADSDEWVRRSTYLPVPGPEPVEVAE